MIKHCLGNSQINSIPAWSKEFSYITFLYRTLAEVNALARADITSIHSQREMKEFSTLKPTLSLTRSIKVHRRALVPYSLPSAGESSNSQYLIPQLDNIHTRNHDTCVDIWRQDGAICSKNRKIVPYYGSARIPRLTVSVPDYGSWCYNIHIQKWTVITVTNI